MSGPPRQEIAPGPVEAGAWPERLTSRVVDPGPPLRVHGYALDEDLARHYGLAEVVLLALTGEAPTAATGRAFALTLVHLAPAPVWEAPAHAALLARLCGAPAAGVLGTGGVALAEQARYTLEEERGGLAAWLARAAGERGEPPACCRGRSEADRDFRLDLRARLAEVGFDCPALAADLDREGALLAVLHACGLTETWQLATALVTARLAVLAAEAFAAEPGAFGGYPMDLPGFRYHEEPEGG